MRRRAAAALAAALLAAPAPACEHGGGPPPRPRPPATLMRGLGDLHHPIVTVSLGAQRFFDQGLRLLYAFNHDEAARAFSRAAELDPKAPMPVWGIALALGPNINLDVDPAREQEAYAAVQRARALAADAREDERAYVEALARRYSDDPDADLKAFAVAYADAMRDVATRHPDDLDAAALFAESLMDLRPWQLWTADGKPAADTDEIVTVLERVLQRDPRHLGANHYYIHALEASPHPERALASAARLTTLAPAAGHLVHMPAHIYMRTGDYAAASRANEAAAEADRAYLRGGADVAGVYPLIYYTHNLHFLTASRAMAGESAAAERAAAAVVANVAQLAPAGLMAGMVEYFAPTPLFVALRFRHWDTLARSPAPDPRLGGAAALWHFARGVAFAATGARARALAEREAFDAARTALPKDALFNLNRTDDVLGVARAVFDARLAAVAGDREAAVSEWRHAVERQDALAYDEPPAWYYPVRESLGAALYVAGRPAEAEAVFRDDLSRNPRNGRSLFGLHQSLRAQGKTVAADAVEREFRIAWAHADVQLRMEEL
ncbi:MAG: hypothetical protein HY271_11410 [Deltaproteobacteria bacterium]|nr:hypothetical protein [Deltaproteobacteria bacterium]